jgi:hypothetical protein
MKTSYAALIGLVGFHIAAFPVFAIETENNRQSPAPQGTSPPDRNAKAQQPSTTDDGRAVNRTKEETNTQSPGNAQPADLKKRAETPPNTRPESGAPKDEAKTPANTEPADLNTNAK